MVLELGFESFLFGMTTANSLRDDGKFYWSSSASPEWCAEYDQQSYIEIDPRVEYAWSNVTPKIWDRMIAGDNAVVQRFLDRAAFWGIGSGVCVPFRDGYARIFMSLNSSRRDADVPKWTSELGLYLLFTVHFYTIFVREVVSKNVPPIHRGAPLSRRELQCLSLAAKGQTSADIAFKLDIVERTVNFHFSNIVSKLDAANRMEAIAIGVARGIVTL